MGDPVFDWQVSADITNKIRVVFYLEDLTLPGKIVCKPFRLGYGVRASAIDDEHGVTALGGQDEARNTSGKVRPNTNVQRDWAIKKAKRRIFAVESKSRLDEIAYESWNIWLRGIYILLKRVAVPSVGYSCIKDYLAIESLYPDLGVPKAPAAIL
jgi:hypothetical protein